MTSYISKDDIEDELVKAGITSPHIRAHLLRKIEQDARRFPVSEPEPLPPVADAGLYSGYKYMCPVCTTRKYLGDFPEYKRVNRRSPVPCLECKSSRRKTDAGKAGNDLS